MHQGEKSLYWHQSIDMHIYIRRKWFNKEIVLLWYIFKMQRILYSLISTIKLLPVFFSYVYMVQQNLLNKMFYKIVSIWYLYIKMQGERRFSYYWLFCMIILPAKCIVYINAAVAYFYFPTIIRKHKYENM